MNYFRRTPVLTALCVVVIGQMGCGSVGADSATITYPTRALSASASSSITLRDTTRMLATSVTLTNTGELPAHLEYGACAVRVLAFRDEARTGDPVWNSDYRKPYHASFGYGCILVLYVRDLQPSTSADFGFVSPLIELVGDSLPNGRYYLAADLLVSAHPPFARIPAGSVDVQLSHPRR